MKGREVPLDGSAKAVLSRAVEESARLRHEYVGTEHIALALLRLTPLTATRMLQDLGVDAASVRAEIEAVVPTGDSEPEPSRRRSYTRRAQQCLACAQQCADELGDSAVGAEHLLVGLLREPGVGGQILRHRGLSPDAVIAGLG